jgi:hypothetical protein
MAVRSRKPAAIGIVLLLLVALGGVAAFAASNGGPSAFGGWQMMGGRYSYRPSVSTPVRSLSSARADAQQFAGRLGLRVDEVMQFERNFYAKLVDKNGNAATEVLVDPSSGFVSIEYGPAMMWNTRYGMGASGASMMGSYGAGMMGTHNGRSTSTPGSGAGDMGRSISGGMGSSGSGGMMGGSGGSSATTRTPPSASGTVSLAEAQTLAQRWLDTNEPGVVVETGGDVFPGYYTLETLKDGKITGMISVNATTGAVWPHWWHGAFIAKS